MTWQVNYAAFDRCPGLGGNLIIRCEEKQMHSSGLDVKKGGVFIFHLDKGVER